MIKESTEQTYGNGRLEFFGSYCEARRLMDYTYFKNYTQERQLFQDTIISKYFLNKDILDKKQCKPWIIFMCGCYGAGKTHTLKHLNTKNILPTDNFVYIDPDKIKDVLPETKSLIEECPNDVGRLLHKEATFIALLIEYIALTSNYYIIVDGSLYNHEWYAEHFNEIKEKYHYKIGIIYVNASLENMLTRCHKRNIETGRIISDDMIIFIHKKISVAVDVLDKYADMFLTIDNNGSISIKSIRFN